MAKHASPEVRRAQILMAAMEVCGRKGYHAARIDDIADKAGLSKGAVYHHFESKQAVYEAVLEQMLDEASDTITKLDAEGIPVADVLRQLIQEQLQIVEGRPELMAGLIHLFVLSIHEPEFQRRFQSHYDHFLESGATLIRHGIERGELRSDVEPDAAARALLMGGDAMVILHVMLGQPIVGIESALSLMELVLAGLAPKETP